MLSTNIKKILVTIINCVDTFIITIYEFLRMLGFILFILPFPYLINLIYKIRHKIVFKFKLGKRIHERKTLRIQEQVSQ